jgi:hypothetical protein
MSNAMYGRPVSVWTFTSLVLLRRLLGLRAHFVSDIFLIDVESFVVKSVRSAVCLEVIMLRDDIRCGC